MAGFSAIPLSRLLLAIGLTVVNYVILVNYDWLAVRYIGHPLSLARVALASFVGYVSSNNFGMLLGEARSAIASIRPGGCRPSRSSN